MVLEVRNLFGGAIALKLPDNALDISQIRQVPDTQEVFVASDSDASFVLEILQRVAASDPKEAVQFLFDSLAHDNEASSSFLSEMSLPTDADPSILISSGIQRIKKFNQPEEDEVLILMAVHRLQSRGVDLVLTNNIPLPKQSDPTLNIDKLKETFTTIAQSLVIVDQNLFA